MFKNTVPLLILFMFLSSSAYGVLENLLIDPVGTHNGFTGAAAVIVDDPSALYYNPAGLIHIRDFGAIISYSKSLYNGDLYYLSCAKNFRKKGSLGLSLYRFNPDEKYVDYIEYNVFPNRDFSKYYDYSYFSVGWGVPVSKRLSVGLSAKALKTERTYYRQGLYTGKGFSTDFGIQITNILPRLTFQRTFPFYYPVSSYIKSLPVGFAIGASIYNLGPKFTYFNSGIVRREELPCWFHVGARYSIIQSNILSLIVIYDYTDRLKPPDQIHYYRRQSYHIEIVLLQYVSIQYGKDFIRNANRAKFTTMGLSFGTQKIRLNYNVKAVNNHESLDYFGLSLLF